MGSELVKSPAPLPFKYTDIFYEALPFYLSIGMPNDEFWNGDCFLVKHYIKAYEMTRARDNYKAWIQGAYIYEGTYNLSPILHAFADKNSKAIPYPSKPFPLTEREADVRKEEREKEKMLEMKRNFERNIGLLKIENKQKEGNNA